MKETPGELFPASEGAVLSPKLRWLAKHGLKTEHTDLQGWTEDDFGEPLFAWACYGKESHGGHMGEGNTEDEACADYAQRAWIKLWNEEENQ